MPARPKRVTVPGTTVAATTAPKKPPTRRATKPKKTATGDCYEAAAKYILSIGNSMYGGTPGAASSLRVVHAEVAGQGPLEGTTFGHGFVVDMATDVVIDKSNGRDLQLPRMLYYAIGGIEEIGNYHVYTYDETVAKMLQSGHYGPWDLRTSSGL